MKTISTATDRLDALLVERQQAADVLQNDINQTLASVLLWIQFTKIENNLKDNAAFRQAERNLKTAIDRVSMLHYALSENPVAALPNQQTALQEIYSH